MNKIIISIVLLSCLILLPHKEVENPTAEISNGIINANLFLPDTKNGYYMATRFDWAGIISSLEYKGHNYFGQWFVKYSPTIHDAIMGPVDSFSPLNYNETNPGGTFVKIGVGILTKPSGERYNGFNSYSIVDNGTWEIKKEAAKIEFKQVLNDKDYPYIYTKTIELIEGKPEMVLSHTLKNTGKRTIETKVFNHNFFVIDNQQTGPDFELIFSKNISGTGRGMGDIAELHENKIKIKRLIDKNESVYCTSLQGINNNNKDVDIKIENHKTGAAVRITGDQPLSKLVFWCSSTTICPEPYIKIKIEPGGEFSWKYNYEFYITDGISR